MGSRMRVVGAVFTAPGYNPRMSEAIPGIDWSPPPTKIRHAASILLVREGPDGGRIFWMRRGTKVSFGPGMYAFPGGKVDAADAAVPVVGASEAERPFVVAAIREAFEEVGILLAEGAERLAPEEAREMREALLGGASFGELLERHGLRLDARRLVPAGRWFTPPFSPIRFDTRFYLARLDGEAAVSLNGEEVASAGWIAPEEALAMWERGEALLHPPTHHALAALAGFPPEKAVGVLRTPPYVDDENVVHRIEFQRGIHLFPLRTETLPPHTHTNCIVVGTGELVAIDPGATAPGERERIFRALREMEGEGRRVKAVLLTHHHGDHASGAADLAGRLGVPLWASAPVAEKVGGVTRHLEDGETIELAGPMPMRLRCVRTDGHADGHLCFYEERSGAVIAGDMVAEGTTIVIDPPEGKLGPYLDSLQRLLDLPAAALYPAHGFPIPDGPALLKKYIAHREERLRKVGEALAPDRPLSLAEVVQTVYSDTPSFLHPLAERSALASLLELERRGQARRTDGGWTA